MAIKVSNSTVIDDNKIFLPNNIASLQTTAAIDSGTLTLDLNVGSLFAVSLDSNISTLTLSNVQAAGKVSSFVLVFTADGTPRTVVWPVSFKWVQGTAPSITSATGKQDVYVFFTYDGGTTWQAFISGQNL